MTLVVNLNSQRLPQTYIRNNKDCYLDPIRKRLIYITPEETIRQQVVSYLVDELSVPMEMISVEAHLAHYGVSSTRRADIIIHGINREGIASPIAIVECKAPGVLLGEKAAQQVFDYCDELSCDYAMMINDTDCFCFHYDTGQGTYEQIEKLPPYTDLISGKYEEFVPGPFPKRIPHAEIPKYLRENLDDSFPEISRQTAFQLACAAFNFMEGLYDPRHKMPARKYGIFELVEDYGVRSLSYGNASGGVFNGLYRSFIVQYQSTEIVSIGLSTYVSHASPDIIKTAINVAIDDNERSHHALQLVLDDNVEQIGKKFCFMHHGRIAIGHKGSGRISELRVFVENIKPDLIYGSKFNMGTLEDNRLWHLDDPDVISVVENLISYALIRDEYRNSKT